MKRYPGGVEGPASIKKGGGGVECGQPTCPPDESVLTNFSYQVEARGKGSHFLWNGDPREPVEHSAVHSVKDFDCLPVKVPGFTFHIQTLLVTKSSID